MVCIVRLPLSLLVWLVITCQRVVVLSCYVSKALHHFIRPPSVVATHGQTRTLHILMARHLLLREILLYLFELYMYFFYYTIWWTSVYVVNYIVLIRGLWHEVNILHWRVWKGLQEFKSLWVKRPCDQASDPTWLVIFSANRWRKIYLTPKTDNSLCRNTEREVTDAESLI